MASVFPASLDSFIRYVDGTTVMEATTLNNVQEGVEALEAKVGIDSSAVTTSHDYKINQLENQSVFNYTAAHASNPIFSSTIGVANTYQDLDLSAIIGSARRLVYLKVSGSASSSQAKFRTKGDANVGHTILMGEPGGTTVVTSRTANYIGYALVLTNSSGVIEWTATNGATYTINVLGYIA